MTDEPSLPPSVDRAAFEAELAELRLREKAHTHESDAIAAARRRLPMVEMDATLPLIGQDGPTGPPSWTPVSTWPSGRPIAQWSRLAAGRSDDLGPEN